MIGAQFSDQDFEALLEWLGRRGKGITDIVELEGFLTAIVIAPNTISPTVWLPKLWSPRIEPTVREIYAYWLPHRRRLLEEHGSPVH